MGFFDWVTSERYQEMEAARDRALSRNAELLEHGRLLEAENTALREELSYMKLSRDKWQEMAEGLKRQLDIAHSAAPTSKISWIADDPDESATRDGLTP